MAHGAPIRAYLEFATHPDHRIAWTTEIGVVMMQRTPVFMSARVVMWAEKVTLSLLV